MGGIGKLVSKGLDIAKNFVPNPIVRGLMDFGSRLIKGENPLQAALGAATNAIPGGGAIKNVFDRFASGSLMNGEAGNNLLHAAHKQATNPSKVTENISDLTKAVQKKKQDGLDEQGRQNATELSAQRMAELMFA